jgi:AraC family transcriptional regulator of adaptative response / DNA-3-methyladenine glycosylase II
VLGQHVSVAGARTLAARLVQRCGEPLAIGGPLADRLGLTHVFPDAAAIGELRPEDFAMPRARGASLIGLCRAIADGEVVLGPGEDRAQVEAALVALPGIGTWTASYVVLRLLGDPDVFMPADLGVRHALDRLGLPSTPRAAAAVAQAWRPWRSYALVHLWATL